MSTENWTLADLRQCNVDRQAAWRPDQVPDLSFRGNELAGEVGEACNVIKKLERERLGWRGSRATHGQLAEELADVVICADLAALTAGVDLMVAVKAKFDATSDKVGLPHRLSAYPSPPPSTGVDAVAAEREACARIAEGRYGRAGIYIAADIRARTDKDPTMAEKAIDRAARIINLAIEGRGATDTVEMNVGDLAVILGLMLANPTPVGGEAITALYTNWRGETAERTFIPHRVFFGSNEWHHEPQVLIEATDCEKGALRTFAASGFALAKPAPAGEAVREAIRLALEWDERRSYLMPYRVRDKLRSALAPAAQAGTEMHGPFGHLVIVRGLDEEHWRIEDEPVNDADHVSIPMFTKEDPFKHLPEGSEWPAQAGTVAQEGSAP